MNQSVALVWLQSERSSKLKHDLLVNDDYVLVLLNVDLMHSPASGEIMWKFISHCG
jgi:hypothetical protein